MNKNETWIDETLNALEGIRHAEADPGLVQKILECPGSRANRTAWPGKAYYWPVAAGLAILITMNILTLLYFHNINDLAKETPAAMAIDYFSYLGPLNI